MAQLINSKIEEAIRSLIKTAELTAQYGDDELKNLDPFAKMVENLINVRNDTKRAEKAAEAAKDQHTIEDYDAIYARELKKPTKFKPKSTDEYKRFIEETKTLLSMNIESVASTSIVEGEDFLMEIEVSDIDPLTKRRMTHPVKNTICGHYYEKSTILDSIQVNPRLRCPVAGCGNNEFVKKNNLVEDPIFRMKLQRRNEEN